MVLLSPELQRVQDLVSGYVSMAIELSLLMRSHSEVLCIRSEESFLRHVVVAPTSVSANPVNVLDTNPKMKPGMKMSVTAIVG